MPRFDGSLALKLDFGGSPSGVRVSAGAPRTGLRLAAPAAPQTAGKYKALEHRRRQAQINARRQLDLLEGR